MNRKYLVFSLFGLITISLLAAAAVTYLGSHPNPLTPAETAALVARTDTSGSEMAGLTSSEPKPPNEGEIVAIPCKSGAKLGAGDFIVGRPGAFLRVSANGSLKQTTGEELIGITSAYDPTHADLPLELKVECAEDTEKTDSAEPVLYVSNLKGDQFFSTLRSVEVQTSISAEDQKFFETQIDTRCLKRPDDESARPHAATCVHPELFAITDLNRDGRKEYWFNEALDWDTGIGVIEEPRERILTACPGCATAP